MLSAGTEIALCFRCQSVCLSVHIYHVCQVTSVRYYATIATNIVEATEKFTGPIG